MKRQWTAVAGLLLGCVLWAAGGCGNSGRAAVKGQITVDGAPLPDGSIDFIPVEKGAAATAGAKITQGAYAIPAERGLLPGEYQVQIRALRSTGKKVWDGMGEDRAPASQKNMVEQLESYLPARYNDQTELRVRIESGKVNVCDYALHLGKK